MAELYPPSYSSRQQQPAYHHHSRESQHYQLNPPSISYPSIMSSQHSSGSASPVDDQQHQKQDQQIPPQKPDAAGHSKPQATFLTKLYALLERSENHHMIRWDPAGEYIIVEKPEQLALHVLPSVYRQSRFASFSRQLNIYGFMRKVNLRNVDPAIDDPDASTWSHPSLTRHSPPEVVANFKRRVPPRLPKPRKRDADPAPGTAYPSPRSNVLGPISLSAPASAPPSVVRNGRARGFSNPGSYSPLNQSGAPTAGWGSVYPMGTGGQRGAPLPPLTVPSDPPSLNAHVYGHPSHMQSISPVDETPPHTSNGYAPISSYSSQHSGRDLIGGGAGGPQSSHHYSYALTEPQSASSAWSSNSASSHSASLSSLLNPPNGSSYSRGTTGTNQMSYPPPFNSAPSPLQQQQHHHHSHSQHSPDSRPNTGYSAISGYDDTASPTSHVGFDYSRPGSSHHRGVSPSASRPGSSHRANSGSYGPTTSSLSIRRTRRHSQAMSPYPSPYADDQRPSTSPHSDPHERDIGSRGRGMVQLTHLSDNYPYNPTHTAGDFAYSAVGDGDGWVKGGRPSTSASSLSTTTTESPDAGTPPMTSGGAHPGDYGSGEADVSRFTPDFGYVAMNEHLPHYGKELE